jgi:hypothetical protein
MSKGIQESDDIPDDLDFSKGVRGKFYRPGASLSFPVFLDANVELSLTQIADARGIELSALVNELLKKDIENLLQG